MRVPVAGSPLPGAREQSTNFRLAVWGNPRLRLGLLFSIALAWTLLLFCAFQPGLMSWDSIQQYAQGLAGEYGNWHPPFVSFINGIAGRSFGSPWAVLLAQLLVISGGMALLVQEVPPRRSGAALAIFASFLIAPPVWSMAVTLWKDVLMAAALLASVVALRRAQPYWALAWMLVGALCRHNAIFAVAPLAIAAAGALAPARWRIASAVLVLALVAVAPKAADIALRAKDEWTLGALLVFDEVAIYAADPEMLRESPFAAELTPEDIALAYQPRSLQPIFSGGQPHQLNSATLAPRRDAIRAEWLRVLSAHPYVYARHRFRHLQGLLGPICYPFHIGIGPNPWGFRLRDHTLLHKGLRQLQEATRESALFNGWFWVLAAIIVAAVAYRRHQLLAFWTALSGLAYTAGYLIVGVTCDFRYLYWTVIATFAALVLCFTDASERRSATKPIPV